MPGPWDNFFIMCDQILILRNVKIQEQQNYLPEPLLRAKSITSQKLRLT